MQCLFEDKIPNSEVEDADDVDYIPMSENELEDDGNITETATGRPKKGRKKISISFVTVIISICWFAGIVVGFLPLLGWHKKPDRDYCFFLNVMQSNYLVFLYFGTIITPALLLAAFYAHIYQVVVRQLKQMVIMHPEKGSSTKNNSSGGTMVRILGIQQTNEVKATQNLAIIVLFFMICWFPLYTINCIIAFKPDFHVNSNVMLSSIILSHLNSVGNPLLYACHLRDFRAAMKNFFLVLFNQPHRCEPIIRNYGPPNAAQKRSSSVSTCHLTNIQNRIHSKAKLHIPDKVSNIVKTTAAVAAATTGEVNKSIWNIAERSISSSDSSKSLDSCNHDKSLIIRPATPYRPRNTNELNLSVNIKMCEDDESDDGFNEEEILPYHDCILGDCVIETSPNLSIGTSEKTDYCYVKSLSNSSPQLSRGLFFVDGAKDVDNQCESRKVSGVETSPRKNVNFLLSTRQVINLLKGRKPLHRSLSDSGHVCCTTNNGVVNSCVS
nr:uncharacterized protein LOC111511746 [Leptinotarsa decemlineata]